MAKNILLTEEQFRSIVRYQLNEIFCVEGNSKNYTSNGNETIHNAHKELMNGIYNLYKNDENYRNDVYDMGFMDGSELPNRKKAEIEYRNNFTTDFKNEILWGANILKNYVGARGLFDINKLKADYPNDYRKLLGIREFLDMKGLGKLYDDSAIVSKDNKKYGYYGFAKDGSISPETFSLDGAFTDINDYNEDKNGNGFYNSETGKIEKSKLSDDEAIMKMRGSALNLYMNTTYGIGIDVPMETFKRGNHKLSNTTLIINFTSAMRCAAWNECLLRNVCYARNGEKVHVESRNANTKMNLLWEAAHRDEKIRKNLFDLLRLFVVNYDGVLKKSKKLSKKYNASSLSKIPFSELDEDTLQLIKENRIVTDIRLNENGDFIGQWLLDYMEEAAGEYRLIDVNMSAYTCRNIDNGEQMDYSKVQNLIINCSNMALRDKAKSGKANIKRFFLAIDENMYNAYDETYGGPNNSFKYGNGGKITVNPQPLYDKNGNPTGDYYYKCPCGRNKTRNNDDTVDCYRCRLCYERENGVPGMLYVLVNCHGSGASEFGGRSAESFGYSKNFFNNINNKMRMVVESFNKSSKEILKEAFVNSSNAGLREVARNCVYSIKKHLNEIAMTE